MTTMLRGASFPMMMASRLSLRGRGERSAKAGLLVGVTGVALSLAVMMAAIAIVTGFKQAIVERVSGINADIVLTASDGGPVDYSEALAALVAEALPGARASVVTTQTGILKTADNFQGLFFKGVDAQADSTFIARSLVAGRFGCVADSAGRGILVSQATALALGLEPGDRVDAFFVVDETVRQRRYTVGGIFNTHFGSFDDATVLVGAHTLPTGWPPGTSLGTSVEIRSHGPGMAQQDAQVLYDRLLEAYGDRRIEQLPYITTVDSAGELYFNWLALLDTNVVVILALMGVVAAFTLISSLFVIILRRVALVGTLKALGATDGQVGNIFVILAMKVTLAGLLIGNAVALPLLWLQSRLHFLALSPENYYLDYVPVSLEPWAIVLLNLSVAAAAFLVIVGPSRLVATISPASTMRYD